MMKSKLVCIRTPGYFSLLTFVYKLYYLGANVSRKFLYDFTLFVKVFNFHANYAQEIPTQFCLLSTTTATQNDEHSPGLGPIWAHRAHMGPYGPILIGQQPI